MTPKINKLHVRNSRGVQLFRVTLGDGSRTRPEILKRNTIFVEERKKRGKISIVTRIFYLVIGRTTVTIPFEFGEFCPYVDVNRSRGVVITFYAE